jgi:type I restriction enzyme R subunit
MPFIDKVIFVVDRKDLDYQTMKEYDKFAKGSTNGNASTNVLSEQLTKPNGAILKSKQTNQPIVVTTIQKLNVFISQNKNHDIYNKHVVLIFDECHRSQFGQMHTAITKAFNNYHIFGFTGTPIFAVNAGSGGNPTLRTTEQAFGDKLHTYTIVDAINDGNVLSFRIDFISTVKEKENIKDKDVSAVDTEKALLDSDRISKIVKYVLEHFDQKTKRNEHYEKGGKRLSGFNSIFAVSSIAAAKLYYDEFKKQVNDLKIATIFSYAANEEEVDEDFDNTKLDKNSRDFLDSAIADYNTIFVTKFDTSADKFQNYYKDLSQRVKNREVDLLIVVNMFLTGFDAKTLNTLWVDKNLRQHGLIQAFSRTNRILNSVKTYGNIVSFRNLEDATNEALSLFGDKEASGVVLLKTYDEYYNGYEENNTQKLGYRDLIEQLNFSFPLSVQIIGEQNEKDFINLFGLILRLKNILTAFDDFAGNEILSARDFQDYQSMYLDLYQKYANKGGNDKENINEDIVFEIELIKQIEVNIDYILMLVAKYHNSNCKDKSILTDIQKAVDASIQLRSKKELIEGFISRINASSDVNKDWKKFVAEQKEKDIADLIETEKLKNDEARRLVDNAFRDGIIKTTGTDIDKILPPVSRFGGGNRAERKQTVIDKLLAFFEKYFGLI